MSLLVCTVDPDEAIGVAVGVVQLDVEFLDSVFEMCDFAV